MEHALKNTIFEASEVEGASAVKQFFSITISFTQTHRSVYI